MAWYGAVQRYSGSAAIILSALTISANLVGSKLARNAHLPYFLFMGAASFFIAVAIVIGLFASQGWRGLTCKPNEVKWVIGRGICGTGQFVLAVLAAATGAGVGDVGALSSINTVVAALLGRLILNEELGPLHIAAVLLSVVGAALISNPRNFGADGDPEALLGYVLAILSGTSFGFMFICSRKSGSSSSWLLTVSAMSQRSAVCFILAYSPLGGSRALGTVALHPYRSFVLLVLLIVVTVGGNFLATVGAKRCPAAVSATLMTAVSMVVGYGAQVLIFDKPPTLLAVIGAVMMFFSVVTMALARLPPRKRDKQSQAEEGRNAQALRDAAPEIERHESQQSFASFVASEYSQRMPPAEQLMPQVVQPSLKPRAVKFGVVDALAST